MNFNLTASKRQEITTTVIEALESSYQNPDELVVSKTLDEERITEMVNAFDFDQPHDTTQVIMHVIEGLKEHAVHSTHPSYFGLFNPRANFPSVMADVINSYLNPQLAAWSHSPYAVELERFVIKELGKKFGYKEQSIDGTFCTGGAESNLTAVLSALNKHFPEVADEGISGILKRPIIYCSTESHHSIEKAARVAGLGKSSVKAIAVENDLRMDMNVLQNQIKMDIGNGLYPLMIVGTAGTTGAGSIDNLEEILRISKEFGLWFHVDAAYGGAAILSELNEQFKGIENSDSITLDLHKWFSVPMATSLFLTSDTSILHNTFSVKTDYMPADGNQVQQIDSYIHSIQWSRRFIGLRIYLPLAAFGWDGYAKTISHQIEMGNKLRSLLEENGWVVKNQTELPIVCFTHPDLKGSKKAVEELVDKLVYSGETWLSTYPINGELTLRACITNYDTQEKDLINFTNLLSTNKNTIAEGICC